MTMASFERSDPQTRSGGKPESSVRLISLASGPEFDWTMFDLFLKLHVSSQWLNGNYAIA